MRCQVRVLLASLLCFGLVAGCAGPPTTSVPPIGPTPPPTTNPSAPPISAELFPAPGATRFTTANANELLSDGSNPGGYADGLNGRAELDDASVGGKGQTPTPPATPAPPPEPTPDVTREIVEADVYKVDGNLLYVLNRYRGLVIIDVTNPDQMVVRGRLAFQAMPIEMYVRDGRAYVVSSDYFQYWQYDPETDPHGFHGSQVMIADVKDPAHPKRLGSFPVEGEVTDTRMVGDVIYTVSKRRPDYWRYNTADWEDRTWIASLNVADPTKITPIDKVTFSGTSTLIHVAHHAIFVAAWDPNYYLTDPGLEQETLVTYVDISAPGGQIKKGGSVYIPGQIADKFKMDWFDGHLRVLSQRWNGGDDITLNVVATAHPDVLQIDRSLALTAIKRSGLQATRFDGARAFAFSVEWSPGIRQQYLHAIDLSTPLAPVVAGKLAVNVDATHLQVSGDRLLVLGQHYQQTSWPYYGDRRVAIALYDVTNLAAMSQLSMARLGLGWSSSQANSDYKAFKVFPQLGLLLVPLSYYLQGQSFNGVQLVDWKNDTITERGRVPSTGGVQRAFPVGNRLIAVGPMAVLAIDATNRDNPTITRTLNLVHQVSDVFEVQGLQVQLLQDPYSGEVRLEVRNFGDADDSPTLASLKLPYSSTPFVLRDGDLLHLIGSEAKRGQVVHTADLTAPKSPKLRGDLLLTDAFQTVFHPSWGWYTHYWSPYAGLPLRNQIVPATFRQLITLPSGRREWKSELRFLDLRDPDKPRIALKPVPMNDYPFVNKVTHGNVLYSTHVEQATSPDGGGSLLYHVRAYVDRVDVTNPDQPKALPSVNIPGYLVDVSDDGKLWYTVDYQWDDFGRRRNSINVLRLLPDDKTAQLITVIPVADQINRAALRPGQLSEQGGRPAGWNDRTIWLTAHKYPWWGVKSDTISSRQPYTIIRRVDFAQDGTLALEQKSSFAGYHFDLLDVQQSQMYLSTNSPNGLLVVDLSQMATPTIVSSARTIGFVSRIVVNGAHTYAPLGMYGLQQY